MPVQDTDGSIRSRVLGAYRDPAERVDRQKLANCDVPFSELWLSAEPQTPDGSEFKGLWRGLVKPSTVIDLKPALSGWAHLYDANSMGHVGEWEKLARGNEERTVTTTIIRCVERLLRASDSPRLTPTQISVCEQQLALAADMITTAAKQPHMDRQCEIARVSVDDPEAAAILGDVGADGQRITAEQLNAIGTLSSLREFSQSLAQTPAATVAARPTAQTPRAFAESLI